MKRTLTCLLLIVFFEVSAQDDQRLFVSGYVKDMVTISRQPNDWWIDNLVHNRINFRWEMSQDWTFRLDLRNRFFFGDQVRITPGYGSLIDTNNDYFDLSLLGGKNNAIGHTYIDRMYAEWAGEKMNVRIGRQRINWGLNLVWNPNDIFNAYSFFDFDYEERPGSDAIRAEYFLDYASSIELAVRMADDLKDVTVGGMYKFNYRGYDIQILGGVMRNNLVTGGGWAGNIGQAGLKGEVTYFRELDLNTDQVLASISADYSFPNSLYFNGSMLFNSEGKKQYNPIFFDPSQLDVRSLSPYKYSYFLQSSYQLTPLTMVGLAGMLFQDNSYLVVPTLTVSIIENLDLDVIAQLYYPVEEEICINQGGFNMCTTIQPPDVELFFVRLKYSY